MRWYLESHRKLLPPVILAIELWVAAVIRKEFATEVPGLWALVQVVYATELVQNAVEAIQQRDPVVEITSTKRPARRKIGKVIR